MYGVLTLETDAETQYTSFVTVDGTPIPYVNVKTGGTYKDATLGYSIDLLPDWKVESQDSYGTLISGDGSKIHIKYTRLASGADPETELVRLAESQRQSWERWTRGWDESEVKSFNRESADGQDSYWIRYYGHESPGYCDIDVIERVMIATHAGDQFGVVLQGSACGSARRFAVQDIDTMIRSFTP